MKHRAGEAVWPRRPARSNSTAIGAAGCLAPVNKAATDDFFLRRALQLARRSLGRTSPNPCVGAVLVRDDLRLLPELVRISRRSYAVIRQNVFWAFFYNVIGIPLAAAGLLSPVVAGAAMAFSSVSVVTNALLLKRWKPTDAKGA